MAFPVIPDEYLDEFQKQQERAPLKERAMVVASKTTDGLAKLADFLIILTATFWFYFFTGLAILFKRDVPSAWLRMGTRLWTSKISSRKRNPPQNQSHKAVASENVPQKTFKVVDVDTKRPLKTLSVNKK